VAAGGVRVVVFGGFCIETSAYVPAGGAGLDGAVLSLLHPTTRAVMAEERSISAERRERMVTSA
jgi:hypothetical protein